MAKKILIDVPPIHNDGLKVFEKDSDIEIIRFDRGNQSLEDEIKDVDAVMAGIVGAAGLIPTLAAARAGKAERAREQRAGTPRQCRPRG